MLTNKYAEGYPGKRYYGGCEHVDVVETLAIERAKALFGAEHANVQPHSGAQANMAVLLARSSPATPSWGWTWPTAATSPTATRSTSRASTSHVVPYGVRQDDERIDYDEVARLARERTAEADHRRRQRLPARRSTSRASATIAQQGAARCSWSTWRTSPGWSPPGCTRARCRTPTSSPPPRTRRCAARAAA